MADTHAHSAPAAHHGSGAAHSHDSHDAEHVAKHIKAYLLVGFGLLVLTLFTVFLSYVDFGSARWNIIVAMIVATFKAGLVAAIFMHLKGERMTIWRFLFFTAFFVAGLFLLTLFHLGDPISGSLHTTH